MARILIIDDNDLFRGMLHATLDTLGHEVTEAADGTEGLKWHARGAFDLVITDLIMPETEGIETILELLKRAPETRIIAMSGGGRASAQDYLGIASRIGARKVLAKPFSRDALDNAIREVMA